MSHILPKNRIKPRLVSFTVLLEPSRYIGIQFKGNRTLFWLKHLTLFPRLKIGKIFILLGYFCNY